MSEDEIPEADCAENAPHPRQTEKLFGQGAAEREFLTALADGRRHHAWLLTGPRGIGKATMAWRMARFLRTESEGDAGLFGEPAPAETLDVSQDNAVIRQMAALADPGTLLIRRGWDADRKRLKTQITVDEVRKLNAFFGMSLPDGGARVVIIDSVDEMNASAANALLKVLEEPPSGAVLILVSHQPARLLPTIRSRCRVLRLAPLSPDDLAEAVRATGAEIEDGPAIAELAGGSPGDALRLIHLDGVSLYAEMVALFGEVPRLDRSKARHFIDKLIARGAEEKRALALVLLDYLLIRVARFAAGHPPISEAVNGEHAMMKQLAGLASAQDWAVLQQELSARLGHGFAVNVDPASLLLDAFLQINAAGR